MEPALALATMRAIAADEDPDALRSMVELARVVAALHGKISEEDWEAIARAGAALWNVAMGNYDAEQIAADAVKRAQGK